VTDPVWILAASSPAVLNWISAMPRLDGLTLCQVETLRAGPISRRRRTKYVGVAIS